MRDRDVRAAIADVLSATGAFDIGGVWLWSPEDLGRGTSVGRGCQIEPGNSTVTDPWDAQTAGGLVIMSQVQITLLYRDEDAQKRDEGAENLLQQCQNALNGQSLVGLTLPALTRFQSWSWVRAQPPERQIICTFQYSYIVEGWDNFDTTEEEGER
jgi:hypothetical protein